MDILTIIAVIFAIIIAYVIYMRWNFNVFTKQGIPMSIKPVPVFGTMLPLMKDGVIESQKNKINEIGKTWGEITGRSAVLTTVDTDIIKKVFIKDPASFPSRRAFETGNQLTDLMLSQVRDYDEWKRLRSIISPTFSSGKLKAMMPQINQCAKQLRANVLDQSKQSSKAIAINKCAGSYTMDVIASIAFGLDVNTEKEEDNQFVKHAKIATEINLKSPVFIVLFFFPFLAKFMTYFKVGMIKKEAEDFFCKVTQAAIDERKRNKSERVDFLQLLLDAHKDEDINEAEKPKALTDIQVLAQGISFFIGGYETTDTTVTNLAYNLACFPEKQDILLDEVDKVTADKDIITEKELFEMPYLEMCVNETLRLYPPASSAERMAARDTEVNGIKLPKNTIVSVPIYAMHHHDEFYPNPEEFIPERFSPEEKASRDPLLFMPFGAGPRQCIASRLAMIEIKIAMCHILKTHKFVRAPETEVPLQLDGFGIIKGKNGVYLRVEERLKEL